MIPFLFPLGVFVALFLIWFFSRKGGYKRRPLDAPPGPDWRFTGERFLDPPSGEVLEVWYSPRTGERAYVRARASEGALPRVACSVAFPAKDRTPIHAIWVFLDLADSRRKPRFTTIGFFWISLILSSETSLFNGLRGICGKNFTHALPSMLRGVGTGVRSGPFGRTGSFMGQA